MDKWQNFFTYNEPPQDVIKHGDRIVWFKENDIWYKICSRCGIKKPDLEYYWKHDCVNQRRGTCITCCKDDNNTHYIKIKSNPDLKEQHLKWVRNWNKEKFIKNPELRFAESVRCSIIGYIKRNKHTKNGFILKKENRTYEVMGCTYDEFIEHITSNLEEWMSMDNYGTDWVIGHVVPVAWGESDWNKIKRLYHYKNLYPQCRTENGKLQANIWEEKLGDWHMKNLGDIIDVYDNKWKCRKTI